MSAGHPADTNPFTHNPTMTTYTLEQLARAESLPCNRCEGSGSSRSGSGRPCPYCEGTGIFTNPDIEGIVKSIKGRKGLRSKRPDGARAYYVWRMARFKGGADLTMPITASFEVAGDPYTPPCSTWWPIRWPRGCMEPIGLGRPGGRRH